MEGMDVMTEDTSAGSPAEQDQQTADERSAAPEAVENQAEAVQDDRRWYVVHCYSGYENKVKRNLEQRITSMDMENYIFSVIVPTEEEIEVRDGKRRTYQRRVFPGYILVEMEMDKETMHFVTNVPATEVGSVQKYVGTDGVAHIHGTSDADDLELYDWGDELDVWRNGAAWGLASGYTATATTC